MQSKTSFFSKTIFLKNITRFWPLWAGYIVVCMAQLPISLLATYDTRSIALEYLATYRKEWLYSTVLYALDPTVYFICGCIMAIAIFSYLFQSKSNQMIHSLPVRRECLFITNIISGLCVMLTAHILSFLCSIPICLLRNVTNLNYLLYWLILSLGMSIFAFSLATLCVMITGNIIAAPIIFVIINNVFVAFRTYISFLGQYLCYGIFSETSFAGFLSPFDFLYNYIYRYWESVEWLTENTFSPTTFAIYIGVYFIISIPIFLIAFLVYKKKHLETSGDILTISFLKPFCRWLVTIFVSIFVVIELYRTFPQPLGDATVGFFLPLFILTGIIAFFLTDMIIQKSFHVFHRKRFIECGIIMLFISAFTLGMEYDIFGRESYIPKTEDIVSIDIVGRYPVHLENEDFSQALETHQRIINIKENAESYINNLPENAHAVDVGSISILYTLKNGTTLYRLYDLPPEKVLPSLYVLWDTPDYYMRSMFSDDYDSLQFVSGEITVYDSDYSPENIIFTPDQCQEIYQAFRKDMENSDFAYRTSYNYMFSNYDNKGDSESYHSVPRLNFILPEDIKYYGDHHITEGATISTVNAYIPLTIYTQNTLQLLEDYGLNTEEQHLLTRGEYWTYRATTDEISDKENYNDMPY